MVLYKKTKEATGWVSTFLNPLDYPSLRLYTNIKPSYSIAEEWHHRSFSFVSSSYDIIYTLAVSILYIYIYMVRCYKRSSCINHCRRFHFKSTIVFVVFSFLASRKAFFFFFFTRTIFPTEIALHNNCNIKSHKSVVF